MSSYTIDSTAELVEHVSLSQIRVYETGSRAKSYDDLEASAVNFNLGYAERTEGRELEDRFRFVVETPSTDYLFELGAIYTLDLDAEIPQDVRIDFAERVGFMALFPYLREYLTSSAARLNRPGPLLDFVRPGDMKITESSPEADDADPASSV
ncbi:hypothetical protein GCM10009860_21940 [Microbacterium mitrae]|uniref:Protein-export chaperone SecB n=1 Tax=Microbacterium mitrae TaxID=664640 RepID=A0A5C8HMQ4_9MICO|nr:hypothetical protein [Microbacterium mitrae]TXK04117.1 hypothetical protein FVP60_10145 [Microbacterium mitrae]